MRKTLIAVAAGVLLAAFALPALAATPTTTSTTTTTPSAKAHRHWFAGSVSSVGSSSLTIGVLWTGPNDGSFNGTTVSVAVDSNTQIKSRKNKTSIQLSDIQSGDLVAVSAVGTDASDLTAAKIRVYCDCHWVGGRISALGSSSLTVQVKRTGPYDTVLKGQAVTIQTSSSTLYIRGKDKTPIQFSDLEVGDGVGVIFSASGFFKAPGFDPSTATFTAKRVHVWGHDHTPPASTDAASAAQTAT